MAEKRERLGLARAAARLAARRGLILPPLILMTDDERLPDPLAAALVLPRGSIVIVRSRDPARRATLTAAMLRIARTRALFVLVAGDPALASRLDADGIHLPERRAGEASHWRALRPRWLITVASHGHARAPDAANAIILSAIFPTKSHIGRAPLGALRANIIAAQASKPVYALGGVTAANATSLSTAFNGIAAIGALSA